MKSFFYCLTAVSVLLLCQPAEAGVQSAAEPPSVQPVSQEQRINDLKRLYSELPDISKPEILKSYLRKRLQNAIQAQVSESEIATPSSTSIVNAKEIKAREEQTLSSYEKIYHDSMQKAGDTDNELNSDIRLEGTFYRYKEETKAPQTPFVPDFPYVTVKLSDNREILAPADEHLPYLLTTVRIEPTGLLRVTEEFVFISNNEGFPQGFFRILPKYNCSRYNKCRRTDITLEAVTVNGEEKPYKMSENGNYLYIEPVKPLELPTGIYTYRFKYTLDRVIWNYDNYDELTWDITARTLKNVVGSANAVIILPSNQTFLAQNAIASIAGETDYKRVTITSLAPNSLAFADTNALGVGDDIHLFVELEKGTLVPPDFSKKYQWFIHDYGANLFAILALLAILLAYRISLIQIRRQQDKTSVYLKRTPSLFRLLNANVFDARSLLSEILNLCEKNILELRRQEKSSLLIKKTDNLKKLSLIEQKIITALFPGQETALPALPESQLKLERAYKKLRFFVYKQYHLFKLKLNLPYIVFSILMLTCGIIGTAALAVSPAATFWTVWIFTLLFFPCIGLLSISFHHKLVNGVVKFAVALLILVIAGIIGIYTSNFYAVLMFLSVYTITAYYRYFSRRSGLLRNKIKETEDYKLYLQKNPELAKTGRDFNVRCPYILAFALEDKYPDVLEFSLITDFFHLLPKTEI